MVDPDIHELQRAWGAAIVAAREAQGMSPVDLARHAGITVAQLSRIEGGFQSGDLVRIRIAAALRIPVAQLFAYPSLDDPKQTGAPPQQLDTHALRRAWGENVTAAREALGMSRRDLALRANIRRETLEQLEDGITASQDVIRYRIAWALGKEMADLFPYPPLHTD